MADVPETAFSADAGAGTSRSASTTARRNTGSSTLSGARLAVATGPDVPPLAVSSVGRRATSTTIGTASVGPQADPFSQRTTARQALGTPLAFKSSNTKKHNVSLKAAVINESGTRGCVAQGP